MKKNLSFFDKYCVFLLFVVLALGLLNYFDLPEKDSETFTYSQKIDNLKIDCNKYPDFDVCHCLKRDTSYEEQEQRCKEAKESYFDTDFCKTHHCFFDGCHFAPPKCLEARKKSACELDENSFECRKQKAMRECDRIFTLKKVEESIKDVNEYQKYIGSDREVSYVFWHGIDMNGITDCYYGSFMDESYYNSHKVIKELPELGCNIWDDYRVSCNEIVFNEGIVYYYFDNQSGWIEPSISKKYVYTYEEFEKDKELFKSMEYKSKCVERWEQEG